MVSSRSSSNSSSLHTTTDHKLAIGSPQGRGVEGKMEPSHVCSGATQPFGKVLNSSTTVEYTQCQSQELIHQKALAGKV